MKTRRLGPTELDVSAIGLGAMPLSLSGRPDEKQAVAVLHAAFDAGITLVDTADVYCLDHTDIGHNERLIAKALESWHGDRDQVIVATKGGLERPGGDWTTNGHPDHLKKACEASLVALGVDTIDLYQLHAPDPDIPFEDTVGALADLKDAGKIRFAGLSNVSVPAIERARGIIDIVSVQNRCNPFERQAFFTAVVSYCDVHGIAFLPHSPVGGHHGHVRTRHDSTLTALAERRGCSPYQIILAWFLAISPVIVPIPGASRVESALSSAAAADLELTAEDREDLERAFPTTSLDWRTF